MTLVVGVAGGTGSGKTTLTNRLLERFSGEASVIFHDNYYKAHDELTYEERCLLNYDHPDAFDNALMVRQLERLVAGQAVDCPVYDYSAHNRSCETTRILPAPVVIVEGILIYAEPAICDLIDIKIFVDTDADVRGRTLESVERQYLTTVKPMHELYVEPSKRNADLIIPEGGHNLVALDMLVYRISQAIS